MDSLKFLPVWTPIRELAHSRGGCESTDLDNTAELIQPDASAISNMSAAELMQLVQELPAGFRTVFNLFAIEGYSHKEISDMLNITESTSRSQFTRAKQMLQKRINALY